MDEHLLHDLQRIADKLPPLERRVVTDAVKELKDMQSELHTQIRRRRSQLKELKLVRNERDVAVALLSDLYTAAAAVKLCYTDGDPFVMPLVEAHKFLGK